MFKDYTTAWIRIAHSSVYLCPHTKIDPGRAKTRYIWFMILGSAQSEIISKIIKSTHLRPI